jgi:hypothetical protein
MIQMRSTSASRLVTTARHKIVRLTPAHAMANKVQTVLSRSVAFFQPITGSHTIRIIRG